MNLLPFFAGEFGWIAGIAIALNIVLILTLIGLGKAFAKHLLAEIRAIKRLLGDETSAIRATLTNHEGRISRLEGRVERE